MDFYDEYEKKTTTLTSKNGRVDDATQNLYAKDSVVVVSDSAVNKQLMNLCGATKIQKLSPINLLQYFPLRKRSRAMDLNRTRVLQNYVIYNITYVTRRDSL